VSVGEHAGISLEELQLAARNHGMPLEALRHEITPVGLHYLLVHFDIPAVDAAAWTLEVGGLVEQPLSLSLDDLRARDAVELPVTMECAGNGRAQLTPRPVSQPWLVEAVGTARWRGVPLAGLLSEAGPLPEAVEAVFTGLDRGVDGGEEQDYARALSLEDALADGTLLAYEMNGEPLPPQHGFPLRLVVPGWYGMASVKWLARIELVGRPFTGYQQAQAYRFRQTEDEEGEPVTRIAPRSLMVPPGIPDFFSRDRLLPPGPCLLEGRAWSGGAAVEAVDVTTDGGLTWTPAELGPARPEDRWAWRRWTLEWDAQPGEATLGSRARTADGAEQPHEPPWNLGGYANNAVQWLRVTVGERA
jgi:DMSO/TMAO reductase YedYZ molybdopterin-dependent catalytic subunit